MKGKDRVTTTAGGILTVTIMIITLGYFVSSLQGLAAGSNPTINYNLLQNYYGPEKGLNLYESNHSFAVSVISNDDDKPKYDPRYVTMVAYYYYYND